MKKLHKAVQELKFWQIWDKAHRQKYATTLIIKASSVLISGLIT